MSLAQKDLDIISHLRSNSRNKINHIADKIGMPQSTLYSRLDSLERKGIVKHSTLINFKSLGLISSFILLKVPLEKRKEFEDFIADHSNLNSLYKTNLTHDFLLEAVFNDLNDQRIFFDQLKRMGYDNVIVNVVEEVVKERWKTFWGEDGA